MDMNILFLDSYIFVLIICKRRSSAAFRSGYGLCC